MLLKWIKARRLHGEIVSARRQQREYDTALDDLDRALRDLQNGIGAR